jgi:uncharacterized protein (UPF0335 family)
MIDQNLHHICERVARLESEKRELSAEISQIKKDAQSDGYDPALITRTVRMMLMNDAKRQEALTQHDLFDTYLAACNLIPDFRPLIEPTPAPPPPAVAVEQAGGADAGPDASPADFDMGEIPEALRRKAVA